jgi:hypothetical protein
MLERGLREQKEHMDTTMKEIKVPRSILAHLHAVSACVCIPMFSSRLLMCHLEHS